MAAINAAGYDAEIDSTNNDPLRGQIRKAVESSHAPSPVQHGCVVEQL